MPEPRVNNTLDDTTMNILFKDQSPEVRQVEYQTDYNNPQFHQTRTTSDGCCQPLESAQTLQEFGRDKEVDPNQWNPRIGNTHRPYAIAPSRPASAHTAGEPQPKHHPLKRRMIWMCLVVLTVLFVIGLVVGLVVHFVVKKPSPPPLPSPEGAMNYSGVAALDLGDGSRRIALYSQHHNGEIRKYEFLDGTWSGGSGDDVLVTSGARNGTPLMGVSYAIESELIWRVFYVDWNDILQETIYSNLTQGGWAPGPLGNGGFKASTSAHVGLSVCRSYQWYGAPYNVSGFGLRLYYGGADHAIHELTWAYGHQAWSMGQTFEGSNGDGGLECTIAHSDPPSITNLWMLNAQGELEQQWYDFDDSARSATHETSTWVKGLTSSGPRQNSAITAITLPPGTQKLVHFQMANNTVRELIANGTAETSKWSNYLDIEAKAAIPNSRLGSVILTTSNGGDEIHVFYQTNGTDMTDHIRTLDGDTWSLESVPTGPP